MSTFKINVPAGPIWNQQDAELKAPIIAAARLGKWTGHWNTVVPGEMSVVELEYPVKPSGSNHLVINVVAGPIWDVEDAKIKCPVVCASYGGEWTGHWHTPKETFGKMSVCERKFVF